MHAILVHIIGFALVNQVMPDWVHSASRDALVAWYAGFVLIDFLALTVCWDKRLKALLCVSCAWSACLMADIWSGSDLLQQGDYYAQVMIDAAMIVIAGLMSIQWRREHAAHRSLRERNTTSL